MTPGGTQQRFNLEEEQQGDYTISIRGKALTLTKERIRNRNNALIIERPDGEKFYFDLDANGEFSGNIITPDTLETIKAYWNTSTMTEFREKTISLNKDSEAYPINRVIAGYFDAQPKRQCRNANKHTKRRLPKNIRRKNKYGNERRFTMGTKRREWK